MAFAAHLFGVLGRFQHLFVERHIKVRHHVGPLLVALRHLVETFFHFGGKIIIQNIGKVGHQKLIHQRAYIGRKQLGFLRARVLAQEFAFHLVALAFQGHITARNARLVFFNHIFALHDGGNGGRVGGRTTNAQLFQLLYQHGFGVARRMLRKHLAAAHPLQREFLTFFELGQTRIGLFFIVFVFRFGIHLHKTVKHHHLALGHKHFFAARHFDGGRGAFYFRFGHLRGNGAFPNQVVEPHLSRIALNVHPV